MMFSFSELRQLADMVARTQYNGVRMNTDQTFLVFLKGQSLGLHPMQAIDLIQVIQGRVTLSPQGMLALINRSKELVSMDVQSGQDFVQVTMTSKTMSHTETFTIADATAMGLITKDNWRKQPLVMLKWRAISACCRVVFPHVIMGMYLTEEIDPDQNVAEDGSLLPTVSAPALPEVTPSHKGFVGAIKTITRTKSNGWTVITDNGTAYTTRAEAFHQLGYDANTLLLNESTHDVMGVVEADWFENDKWCGYVVKKMYIPSLADELDNVD